MAPKQDVTPPKAAEQPAVAAKPAAPAAPAAKPAAKTVAMPAAPLPSTPGSLTLPMTVVGPSDVARLLREVATIDDFLYQASIRKSGEAVKMPKASRSLDLFCEANKLNILQEADRKKVKTYLEDIKQHAPVIHISFASDPSSAFVGKLILWLRGTIHPNVLVRLGLEPTIAAGCVVRTQNKQFDFSLRHRFDEERNSLFTFLKDDPNTKK